jgi:hypothetical protein
MATCPSRHLVAWLTAMHLYRPWSSSTSSILPEAPLRKSMLAGCGSQCTSPKRKIISLNTEDTSHATCMHAAHPSLRCRDTIPGIRMYAMHAVARPACATRRSGVGVSRESCMQRRQGGKHAEEVHLPGGEAKSLQSAAVLRRDACHILHSEDAAGGQIMEDVWNVNQAPDARPARHPSCCIKMPCVCSAGVGACICNAAHC